MFAAPRYVLKDGELIIEDHEFLAEHEGRILHVAPEYDRKIEQVIEPSFWAHVAYKLRPGDRSSA